MFFINDKTSQIEILKKASFDDIVYYIGKNIYDTIIQIVRDNEEEDRKYYKKAILQLDDHDRFEVPLKEDRPNLMFYITCPKNNIIINFNYIFNSYKPGMGINFLFESNNNSNEKYSVGSLKNPFRKEPSPEQKELIINSLKEALEKVKKGNYLKEATHNKNNYNEQGNAIYYNEAMKYMQQIDPNRTVFPSVEYAVYSIINNILFKDYPDKEQLEIFTDILKNKVMEQLKTGRNAIIFVNNGEPIGILENALEKAKIEINKKYLNIKIDIGIDMVKSKYYSWLNKTWNNPILTNYEVHTENESSTLTQYLKQKK